MAFVLLEENAGFLGTSDGAGGGEDLHLHIILKNVFPPSVGALVA